MKYEKELLKIITSEFQSTEAIRKRLSDITGKSINWLSCIRWNEALQKKGLIESQTLSRIIFWKKK